MKRNFNLWAMCIAVFALFSGCSESDEKNEPDTCTDNSQCENGQICKNGKCIADIIPNNTCTDSSQCKDGQICQDGKCVAGNIEPECSEINPCPHNDICIDGKCIKGRIKGEACSESQNIPCAKPYECINETCMEIIPKAESCNISDKYQKCADDLVCVKSTCRTPSEFECEEDADCAGSPDSPFCISHRCASRVAAGKKCNDINVYCEQDLVCIDYCVRIVGENESCRLEAYAICDEDAGLGCFDGICLPDRKGLTKGEECNDINLKCNFDLKCVNGRCSQIAAETQACSPEEFIVCDEAASQMCLNSICAPVGGSCQSSADCTEKDSYCCLSESCGAPNRCVPYDHVTAHDDMCRLETKPGIFEARVQCRWQPPADLPQKQYVEVQPLAGHFGSKTGIQTTVAFLASDGRSQFIHFIDPETCETLESIEGPFTTSWSAPAAADLDGDGLMEFIVHSGNIGLTAYKWNKNKQKHEVFWRSSKSVGYEKLPLVYDINGDGLPEVVAGKFVINGQTGEVIHEQTDETRASTWMPALGNFDRDPKNATLVDSHGIHKWNDTNKTWDTVMKWEISDITFISYADFGTPGKTWEEFDYTTLDGYPEFVLNGGDTISIEAIYKDDGGALSRQTIMAQYLRDSGPAIIGDFNNDGLPELACVSKETIGVYDPKCSAPAEGKCESQNVVWQRWADTKNEFNSVANSSASLFDFDDDGQTELVFSDKTYTRVYNGNTGKVLFSTRRSSEVQFESSTIVDADNDGSAELIAVSGRNIFTASETDEIHEGIPCLDDEDCPSKKNCNKTLGLCLCQTDEDCNTEYFYDKDGNKQFIRQYQCTTPVDSRAGFYKSTNSPQNPYFEEIPRGSQPEGYNNDYKVCRAYAKGTNFGSNDLVIYRDRLDRWVSARNIWNQYGYNIINIEDDGKVPAIAKWIENLLKLTDIYVNGSTTQKRPLYNSYRMNSRGLYGAGSAADITGRFIVDSICGKTQDNRYVISANLCNRGTKPVATKLPATFYYYDETAPGNKGKAICTSYTPKPVGIGECGQVGCAVEKDEFDKLVGKDVLVITNEDEFGQPLTLECNNNNNIDKIHINKCASDIAIIN